MKKILFVFASVALLAAGCSSSQTASMDAETGGNTRADSQTQAQASVKVNGADDAVNLIEQSSVNEQSQVTASDDSDLSSSDSAELDSLTEVSNGY